MRNLHPLVPPRGAEHPLAYGLAPLLLGLALLLAGRRLFWLFVGTIGFAVAEELVTPLVASDSRGVALIVALIAGLGGAVLAIFMQKVAIGLAGALAGAYYVNVLLTAWPAHDARIDSVVMLVGAVVGALLLLLLFKWALILFSSVAGAHLIVRALVPFGIGDEFKAGLFLGLLLVGVFVQGRPRAPRTDE